MYEYDYKLKNYNISGNHCYIHMSSAGLIMLLYRCLLTIMFKLQQVDILISKNQVLQLLYLKHHNNVYKSS